MELFFQGARKSGPRDTMLRLDTIAEGALNAVVFWFDLHLDDKCTITSGPLPSCLQVRGLGVQQNVWQLLSYKSWLEGTGALFCSNMQVCTLQYQAH